MKSFKELIKIGVGAKSTQGVHGKYITNNCITLLLELNNQWKKNKDAELQKEDHLEQVVKETEAHLYKLGTPKVEAFDGNINLCVWEEVPAHLDKVYYDFITDLGLELYVDHNSVKLSQMINGGQVIDYYANPFGIRTKEGRTVGAVMGVRK